MYFKTYLITSQIPLVLNGTRKHFIWDRSGKDGISGKILNVQCHQIS